MLRWNIGDLAPGQSAQFNYATVVNAVVGVTLQNVAVVASQSPGPTDTTDTTDVAQVIPTAPPRLPVTGSTLTIVLMVLATGLLLVGGSFTLGARRRHRAVATNVTIG